MFVYDAQYLNLDSWTLAAGTILAASLLCEDDGCCHLIFYVIFGKGKATVGSQDRYCNSCNLYEPKDPVTPVT